MSEETKEIQKLPEELIVAEGTNDMRLDRDTFTLGNRTFTVVSLQYRQYLQFMARLKPLLEAVASKVRGSIAEASGLNEKINVSGITMNALNALDPDFLMGFCADSLPAMVEIICNMKSLREERVDDVVDNIWVEKNAQSPFQLVNIVLLQVNKNNMIVDFASFFAEILPLLMGGKKKNGNQVK